MGLPPWFVVSVISQAGGKVNGKPGRNKWNRKVIPKRSGRYFHHREISSGFQFIDRRKSKKTI
jgi:hypothetical protein